MKNNQTWQRGPGRGLFMHIVPDVLWNSWSVQHAGRIGIGWFPKTWQGLQINELRIKTVYYLGCFWFELQERLKTAFFLVITQPVVVFSHRRFGTTYQSRPQASRI